MKIHRKKETVAGLEKGFAKALKDAVNGSLARRNLKRERTPGWWRKLG